MTIHYQQWRSIKTPSDLKYCYEEGNGGHFFDRSSMRFFGDTMRNYGVRRINLQEGFFVELYRKHPVKHGLQSSVWFSVEGEDRTALRVKHSTRNPLLAQ